MIWVYEKDARALRIETRYDNRTLQYVLTVHRPEGAETERYGRLEDFRDGLVTLERTLADGLWHRSGPPLVEP